MAKLTMSKEMLMECLTSVLNQQHFKEPVTVTDFDYRGSFSFEKDEECTIHFAYTRKELAGEKS